MQKRDRGRERPGTAGHGGRSGLRTVRSSAELCGAVRSSAKQCEATGVNHVPLT